MENKVHINPEQSKTAFLPIFLTTIITFIIIIMIGNIILQLTGGYLLAVLLCRWCDLKTAPAHWICQDISKL